MELIPGFSAQQTAALKSLIDDVINKSFEKHFGPRQSIATPPQPQSISRKKKKRNEKTRQQYKKKAQAQAQHVTIQEVEYTRSSKHVFLQRSGVKSAWEWLAIMDCWHAVIQWNEMTMKDGMIMVQINGMPRIGIG